MTTGISQPNPSGSATQGGLSAFAAKTAAQRKTEISSPVKNSLETNFFGKWISNMFGGFFNGVLGLISALVYGLKGITGGLIDLTGALKATDTKAENAQNTATGAVQQVAQVTQKIVAFDIKSPRPGWETINPTEYVSIPWAELWMGYAVSGGSPVTISRSVEPETSSNGTTPFVATTQFYVFIRIPVNDELTNLNFYAKGTPTALHARVHPMDANGDLLEALTPESVSLHAEVIPAEHTSVSWIFPEPVIVEAGTWVCVAFRCVGTVRIMAQQYPTPRPPEGFFPIRRSAVTNRASGVALPSTVTQSSLLTTGTVPYVAIGSVALETPNKRNLSDNFDRPNNNGIAVPPLGPGWSYKSTRSKLDGSGLHIRDNAIVWVGDDNGQAENIYTTPLTTESVRSYIHIGDHKPTAYSTFFIAGNAAGTSGLTVGFRRADIGLWKKGGPGISGGTVLVPAIAWTPTYGDVIEIQQGETVGAEFFPDIILLRHNGVEIIRTTVTTATLPRGKGNRYCGCGVSRTPFQDSTPILDWQAFDVPDVEVVTP